MERDGRRCEKKIGSSKSKETKREYQVGGKWIQRLTGKSFETKEGRIFEFTAWRLRGKERKNERHVWIERRTNVGILKFFMNILSTKKLGGDAI